MAQPTTSPCCIDYLIANTPQNTGERERLTGSSELELLQKAKEEMTVDELKAFSDGMRPLHAKHLKLMAGNRNKSMSQAIKAQYVLFACMIATIACVVLAVTSVAPVIGVAAAVFAAIFGIGIFASFAGVIRAGHRVAEIDEAVSSYAYEIMSLDQTYSRGRGFFCAEFMKERRERDKEYQAPFIGFSGKLADDPWKFTINDWRELRRNRDQYI